MTGLASALRPRRAGARALAGRVAANADVSAVSALALLFAALTAVTWRKWGVVAIDAGTELSSADRLAHGALAYRDIRYFYGPVGVYGLAGAFDLFGTSFTTAFAFGLAQMMAILGAFYVLARQLLAPLVAALATAVLMAIGFSGTAFNLVLPHTFSATFGTLFLLLMLLSLSRDRIWLAGLAAGVLALTRPEFAAVAALTGAAYLVGLARERGIRTAAGAFWRLAVAAFGVAGVVLGFFAAKAGTSTLLWENLWPVDFLRVSDFGSQGKWAPFDLGSAASTAARAVVYCTLLAGLVAAAAGASGRRGRARIVALWPLAAAGVLLLAGFGAWRVLGVFPDARAAVEEESRHLIVGMTWLPALGLGAAALAAVRFLRRESPPITASWAFDLALIVAAAALGLRAYDAFNGEASYAPYYAAPLVLLLALFHDRIARRRPEARPAVLAALGAVAAGLLAYSLIGLYPDHNTAVHTPRGTFVTDAAAAPAFQRAVDVVGARTGSGDAILAGPADAGLYFMTGRRPALYDIMFLPGLLDSRADERAAIARLERDRVPLAVIGSHRFVGYGYTTFGGDYNRMLVSFLRSHGPPLDRIGNPADAAGGTNPARAFTVYDLRR
jgi:hypothetical protein